MLLPLLARWQWRGRIRLRCEKKHGSVITHQVAAPTTRSPCRAGREAENPAGSERGRCSRCRRRWRRLLATPTATGAATRASTCSSRRDHACPCRGTSSTATHRANPSGSSSGSPIGRRGAPPCQTAAGILRVAKKIE